MANIRVCLAGATGWAGSELSRGVFDASDMELVAAISRSYAGQILGEAIDIEGLTTPVFASVEDALKTKPDVFVEYTKPNVAKYHVLSALKSGAHVVIGTSGLSNETYEEINEVTREVKRGVLAVGNLLSPSSSFRNLPKWQLSTFLTGR